MLQTSIQHQKHMNNIDVALQTKCVCSYQFVLAFSSECFNESKMVGQNSIQIVPFIHVYSTLFRGISKL